jgi:hypothetical protein
MGGGTAPLVPLLVPVGHRKSLKIAESHGRLTSVQVVERL